MAGRQRFGGVRMLNRADGVKPILSNLRKGGLLYLLPDMDFGPGESIFAPFFGVPTATVTGVRCSWAMNANRRACAVVGGSGRAASSGAVMWRRLSEIPKRV